MSVALPASLSARSLLFSPACPGKYTHMSFRRWISTIDKIKSVIQCIASLYYLWQNAIMFSMSGFCFVVASVLFCFSVLNFTVLSDLYVSFRMICHFALCTMSLSNYRAATWLDSDSNSAIRTNLKLDTTRSKRP